MTLDQFLKQNAPVAPPIPQSLDTKLQNLTNKNRVHWMFRIAAPLTLAASIFVSFIWLQHIRDKEREDSYNYVLNLQQHFESSIASNASFGGSEYAELATYVSQASQK